jgi:hypothetical protein
MMNSLLSFLGACGESYHYVSRESHKNKKAFKEALAQSENGSLFPQWIAEWASQNSDELGMLQCELDETPNLITEE